MLPSVILALLFSISASFAADLTNEMSPEYVDIPSVEARFTPAGDMALSRRFDGFEAPGRNVEVVAALIRSPFDGIARNFTKETLKIRGVEMLSRSEITINGRRGVLVKALHPDEEVNWGKWILILENGDATLVVNGVFVSGDGSAAADVESMLKGVIAYGEKQTQASPDIQGINEEVVN
jgi:hypothetical protein